jgi:hypothetical protein
MILRVVDFYKAKGLTAMSCGRLHAKVKSVTADADISSLMDSRGGSRCARSMTAAQGPGSAAHALPMKRAQRVPRGVPGAQG